MKKVILSLIVLLICTILLVKGQVMEKSNTTTMKIGLTGIYVKSPVEAFKFYTEILGFVEVLYMPEANLAVVASPLDADGTALLLEPNDNPIAKSYQEGLYGAGLPVIVFVTDDIHKEYERLKKLGVAFKKAPTETEWGIEAVFDDTCGNWIQIQQMKKQSK